MTMAERLNRKSSDADVAEPSIWLTYFSLVVVAATSAPFNTRKGCNHTHRCLPDIAVITSTVTWP